jgi:hypothetical protein
LKELGFKKQQDINYVSYEKRRNKVEHRLSLKDENTFGIDMFKGEWLNRYFQLVRTIKETKSTIDEIYLEMDYKKGNPMPISIDRLSKIDSEDRLLEVMKRSNDALASYYLAYEMEEFLNGLENERFRFEGNHWHEEIGVKCSSIDKNGECATIDFFVHYQKGGLHADNTKLENDIMHIISRLNEHLGPEQEYGVIIEDDLVGGYFTNTEVNSRKDIRKFIEEGLE